MEGISESYKQEIQAHEKEEKWLLCREGKTYDAEITGIREVTTEYGMRDEDGSIAIGGGGSRPGPNVGNRGGAIVTDNPQDGVLRVSQTSNIIRRTKTRGKAISCNKTRTSWSKEKDYTKHRHNSYIRVGP